jgi:hypothetical protein
VRHLFCSLLLVLAVGSTGRCFADEAKDGPSVLFQDSFIENLIGEWDLTRRFPGKMVHNRVSAQWVLNHQFVQLHMIDVESPPKYEALVLIGYDHTAQEYVAHWCDLFGARYSAIGRGKLTNVAALGVSLHAYENFAKAAQPSLGWFLWAMVPYALCLLIWSRSGTGVPALAGVLFALGFDLYTHYAVFIHPTSSTAALAMIVVPLWSSLLFCPVIMLVAWLAVRRRQVIGPHAP